MKAIIDADILVYRVGFRCRDVPLEVAQEEMDYLLEHILFKVGATSYELHLTASKDASAFRRKVFPEYKMNRTQPRPVHYEALREFLCTNWKANISTTIEADDAIGISSTITTDLFTIVSIDKDLLQLPGIHYNFVKDEFQSVEEQEGIRFFYKQLLMGDKADNIRGIEGIGEKKAEKLLLSSVTQDENGWFSTVQSAYNDDTEMLKNGECLWILRHPFPQGTWRFTQYGSRLLQGMEESA